MKNKYLGIICILYSSIIFYVYFSNLLKKYLAPQMQIYLIIAAIPLLIMGIIMILSKTHNKIRLSDFILLLPLLLIIVAGDANLSMSLATNRMGNLKNNYESQKSISQEQVDQILEERIKTKEEDSKSKYDFEIIDSNFSELAGYLTFAPESQNNKNKTIHLKGFTVNKKDYIPKGYFSIGRFTITCCAADASFVGFIVKQDNYKIKNNTWYELTGILTPDKDPDNVDIMTIKIISLEEIDPKQEEQYVYPCYAYDDGYCKSVTKYTLESNDKK